MTHQNFLLASDASHVGKAMQFVMEYARDRSSINLDMLKEAYMLEGHDTTFSVVVDRCVGAGYLRRTMLPGVMVSGFTSNGKLKSLSNFQCN